VFTFNSLLNMDIRDRETIFREAQIYSEERELRDIHNMILAAQAPWSPKEVKRLVQQRERTLSYLKAGKTEQDMIDDNWAMLQRIAGPNGRVKAGGNG